MAAVSEDPLSKKVEMTNWEKVSWLKVRAYVSELTKLIYGAQGNYINYKYGAFSLGTQYHWNDKMLMVL